MPTTQPPTTRPPRRNRSRRDDGIPSSELVYRKVRDQILSGQLVAGSRLIELNLAAEFGVSRTPVREALKRLAAEDFVQADPSRGIVVHAPDSSEIEHVFVVREALDGLASRLAAHRITPSELARLRVIVDLMRNATESQRREQILVANERFHDIIYTASGNPVLARIAGDLRDVVRRFSTLPYASPDRVDHVLAEHEAILAALEAHNPEAAEAASKRHLAAARDYLVKLDIEAFALDGLA